MRGRYIISLTLVCFALAGWPRRASAAVPYPTSTILPGCEDYLNSGERPRDPVMALACRASIATVGDVLRRLRLTCPPPGVSYQTIDRVVVQYGRAHVAQWDENFGAMIMQAYQATWPCR